jgi:DNA-binding response OmpR family regulator
MHKPTVNILLAEDDKHLGMLLTDFLKAENFNITLCTDGEKALKAFDTFPFDLCLLDVMMPKLDGFELAKWIRKKDKNIPIIFITAKSLKEDKLTGYENGADDFITKPFDEEELLWKIKALIRRTNVELANIETEIISIGAYQFDFKNQSLIFNGAIKRMTEKECEILKYLVAHQNKIIKREEMLKTLWGKNDYFLGRSMDVFITKIRKYLKDDATISIENIFGVGFIFNVPFKN